MGVREDLKILLVQENMTLTDLAKLAASKDNKNYTVYSLSQKLVRSTMKYDEMKQLAEILGYKMKFEKIEE